MILTNKSRRSVSLVSPDYSLAIGDAVAGDPCRTSIYTPRSIAAATQAMCRRSSDPRSLRKHNKISSRYQLIWAIITSTSVHTSSRGESKAHRNHTTPKRNWRIKEWYIKAALRKT
ncbi:hypothetical protein BST61_g5149 [Cercospora zeina]